MLYIFLPQINILKIIGDYYEQFYASKFDSWQEMDKCPERQKTIKTQWRDNLNPAPMSIKAAEFTVKHLPSKTYQEKMVSTEFHQYGRKTKL